MHKNTGLSKISKLLLIFFLKYVKKSHKNSTNEIGLVAKRCGLLFHSRQKNMTERLEEKYKSTIKVEDCCVIQDE